MNFLKYAKRLQSEINNKLDVDDLESAGNKFDHLDALYQALKTATNEIKLIKMGSQTQIISRLRKLREDIEILEQDNISLDDIAILQSKDSCMKEVAPGINLRTTVVATEDFIPDSPLYFIRNTGEYAIKVQGLIIKGVIKNIKSTPSSDSWTPGDFLYTDRPLLKKNMHMRHIGSRDSLKSDIEMATRREKETRAAQLAHDLLIQLCIKVI